MNVSVHDLPDAKALHDANPAFIPFGPQAPSVHTDIPAEFTNLTCVDDAIVQQSNPRGRGPLEVVLLSNDSVDNVAGTRATIQGNISTFLPNGCVGRVSEQTHGTNTAVPVDATIIGSVLIWRHPLIPHIKPELDSHGLVYRFDFDWPATSSDLGLDPATTRWNGIENLYVTLSSPSDQLDTVINSLLERVVSEVPRPAATTFTAYTTDDSDNWRNSSDLPNSLNPDDDEIVLAFGFAERELMHDPASGVYNLPAEDLSGVVEHAIEEQPLEKEITSGDARTTTAAGDGIQLTITSPPYVDAIDYESYSAGGDKDWSRSHGAMVDDADEMTSEDELVEMWKAQQREIFKEVYEATREGGYCAVVIGHIKLGDQNWVPLPHEFSSVMQDIGWNFHERVVWQKIGVQPNRFGTTIQHNHPTYYYPNQVHEEIMIWRKGDIRREKRSDEQLEMSQLMKEEISNNVWHMPPVPHNKGVNHPCPFPEELVHRLVVLFSYPGDLVVDPMAGSGTTVKIADRLGRVGIGTELQSSFVAEARRRLSTESYERGKQFIPTFKGTELDGDDPDAALTVSQLADTPTSIDEPRTGEMVATDGHGGTQPPHATGHNDTGTVDDDADSDSDDAQSSLSAF